MLLLAVVDALSEGCEVAEGEVEPRRRGLLQVNPQMLEVAPLESRVELQREKEISQMTVRKIQKG